MFELTDKVVLVVGGRGYLGLEFCRALHGQGAQVMAADLPVVSKAAAKSGDCVLDGLIKQMDVDVTDRASIKGVVAAVLEQYGRIDTLIYSVTAKPEDFYAPFTECSLEGWQSVLRAELDGLFLVAQEVGRVMERQGCGSMIFIASIYGVVGNDQRIYEGANLAGLYVDQKDAPKQIYSHAVYPAAKGGVIALVRYLAAYWGEKSIRVNCVSPGGISHKGENEQFVQKYSSRVPLGRKAELNEISGAIVYLASDEASYVTGQNLVVDGGWTAW